MQTFLRHGVRLIRPWVWVWLHTLVVLGNHQVMDAKIYDIHILFHFRSAKHVDMMTFAFPHSEHECGKGVLFLWGRPQLINRFNRTDGVGPVPLSSVEQLRSELNRLRPGKTVNPDGQPESEFPAVWSTRLQPDPSTGEDILRGSCTEEDAAYRLQRLQTESEAMTSDWMRPLRDGTGSPSALVEPSLDPLQFAYQPKVGLDYAFLLALWV